MFCQYIHTRIFFSRKSLITKFDTYTFFFLSTMKSFLSRCTLPIISLTQEVVILFFTFQHHCTYEYSIKDFKEHTLNSKSSNMDNELLFIQSHQIESEWALDKNFFDALVDSCEYSTNFFWKLWIFYFQYTLFTDLQKIGMLLCWACDKK